MAGVTGEMREGSGVRERPGGGDGTLSGGDRNRRDAGQPHQRSVQEALDAGGTHGWELLSATTTYTGSSYVTSLYWATSPCR